MLGKLYTMNINTRTQFSRKAQLQGALAISWIMCSAAPRALNDFVTQTHTHTHAVLIIVRYLPPYPRTFARQTLQNTSTSKQFVLHFDKTRLYINNKLSAN